MVSPGIAIILHLCTFLFSVPIIVEAQEIERQHVLGSDRQINDTAAALLESPLSLSPLETCQVTVRKPNDFIYFCYSPGVRILTSQVQTSMKARYSPLISHTLTGTTPADAK